MCAKGDTYEIEERSHDQSCDSTSMTQDLENSTNSHNNMGVSQEVVIRPRFPVANVPRHRSSREIDKRREGDFEKEKLVENRMRQLGLLESKRIFESALLQKLKADIDKDGLFRAIDSCRRKRPLRDRMASVTDEIINIIQPRIVKDAYGNKLVYKVSIMMGIYTHNVLHKVSGHEVFIQGTTPERCDCAKLVKEIRIQFPRSVDISSLRASFYAGVFKCEAPFKTQGVQLRSRSLSSLSSYSEDSSLSSDHFKSHDIPAIDSHY